MVLRVLLLCFALAALVALLKADTVRNWLHEFIIVAALAAPAGVLWIISVCAARARLYQQSQAKRLLSAGLIAALAVLALVSLILLINLNRFTFTVSQVIFWALSAGLVGAGVMHYFELRLKAFSPVLTQAKLQALQSRIRPHFLFNSLNTAASLVRIDPLRAEHLLEDLADVFRAALRDAALLVPLQNEIELAKQYLAIEQLRLGERLQVEWKIGDLPARIQVPSLLLQPLLENAVHHGIEPLTEAGKIKIRISVFARELRIEVENSYQAGASEHGTGIALNNVRERLSLIYDLEAQLRASGDGSYFRVYIKMPVQPATQKNAA